MNIFAAISRSRVLLVMVTNGYAADIRDHEAGRNTFCGREIQHALSIRIPIILIIKDDEDPDLLGNLPQTLINSTSSIWVSYRNLGRMGVARAIMNIFNNWRGIKKNINKKIKYKIKIFIYKSLKVLKTLILIQNFSKLLFSKLKLSQKYVKICDFGIFTLMISLHNMRRHCNFEIRIFPRIWHIYTISACIFEWFQGRVGLCFFKKMRGGFGEAADPIKS